jgi:hypothetical protein
MFAFILQALVVMFSLLAGGFWAKSAGVPIPNVTAGTSWGGSGPFPDALKEQARWNRYAAISAAIAAVVQAVQFLVQNPLGSVLTNAAK